MNTEGMNGAHPLGHVYGDDIEGGSASVAQQKRLWHENHVVSYGEASHDTEPSSTASGTNLSSGAAAQGSDGYCSTDREMAALTDELKLLDSLDLDDMFDLIERAHGGWAAPDGLISVQDLKAAAEDTHIDPKARDAAAKLLTSRAFGNADTNADQLLSRNELSAYRAKVKAELEAFKHPGSTAASPPSSTSTGAAQGQSAGSVLNLPTTGDATPDSALRNISTATDLIQQRLATLMSDTENAGKNQAEVTLLNNKLQQLLNMQQTLQTMISNVSKMWSDISMTAVRNIR